MSGTALAVTPEPIVEIVWPTQSLRKLGWRHSELGCGLAAIADWLVSMRLASPDSLAQPTSQAVTCQRNAAGYTG